MTHPRTREAGFTLLETMVALIVLGLLIGGLAQGFRFGVLAWNQQTRTIDRHADLDAVDRTLRGVIEQIDPGNAHDAPTVQGNAASVEFTSELPAGAAALPTRRVEMRLLVDAAHRLILRWAPYSHAGHIGPPPVPTDTVLAQGVDHLEIAYRSRRPDSGNAWLADWQEPDVPGLVRIRLIYLRQSGLQWPAIIAAPRLARP